MNGIFFSLVVAGLGLVLLTMMATVSHTLLEEQQTVSRLVVFTRMQDEVTYVSRELVGIINLFNISVSVNGQTVSITEDLPFPNVGRFQTEMQNWKTFTQANSDFLLTVDVTDISNTLPLTINGQVEYRHTNGVSGNKITIENASVVANYSVGIVVHADGNISVEWDDQSAGSQVFALSITTNNDSFSDSWNLDFSKGSELTVTIDPATGPSSMIELQVGKGNDNGFFKLDNEDRLPMTVTTNITINTTGTVEVTFPDAIINITSDQYDISRITTATVAAS